jgi:hypothetical protein
VLEDALCGHPDSSFVLKLCSNLRFGALLGYDGPRMSKFSKNLKSAIDNPTIVSTNLAKEVALGHTGPFTNPPFANLQVSYLKSMQINFEPFFTSRFQKRENQSIPLSRKTTFIYYLFIYLFIKILYGQYHIMWFSKGSCVAKNTQQY